MVGLTRSIDKGRVPPLKHYIWRMVCNTIFDEASYVVAMSDGASAYRQETEGIYEHFWCNHQEREWTKPVMATYNVVTKEKRQTFASTCFLDSEWRKIKEQVPRGLGVRTLGEIRLKMRYVRAAQWRKMTRGADKWQAFCEAASAWRQTQTNDGVAEAVDDDPELLDEDHPGGVDEVEALLDGADIPDAGTQPVPFGFEATGELELLMRERRVRAGLKAQAAEGQQAVDPPVWEHDDAGSDVTEDYGDDWQQGLGESGGSEVDSVGQELSDPGGGEVGGSAGDDVVDVSDDGEEDEDLRVRSAAVWGDRYFERQRGAACGQHALNNMIGRPQFCPDDMVDACRQVVAEVGGRRTAHARGRGWYSHSVLARVLQNTVPPEYRMLVRRVEPSTWDALVSLDDILGVLVNMNNSHWTIFTMHAWGV